MATFIVRSLFLVLAVVTLPRERVLSQQPDLRSALKGEWTGDLALDAGTHALSMEFQAADTALTGILYDGGQKFGTMEQLKLSGDTVSFNVQGLVFTGIVTGRRMNVDIIVFNGNHRKMTVIKRAEPAKSERDDASRH